MLVTPNGQQTLWETILLPGYQDLPAELGAVDALLDDPVFVEPYRAHVCPLFGRPSIPIETYLPGLPKIKSTHVAEKGR